MLVQHPPTKPTQPYLELKLPQLPCKKKNFIEFEFCYVAYGEFAKYKSHLSLEFYKIFQR